MTTNRKKRGVLQMSVELLHMDCMDYMKTLPDKAFDLAIVDPPYRDMAGNSPAYSMKRTGRDMKTRFGDKPKKDYFDELFRVSNNQIVWGANNFLENLKNTNCFVFWDKKNPVSNFSDGELAWTSFKSVARCFSFAYFGSHEGNTIAPAKIHPTQKPVKLYEWLLKNYAKPGDRILDTHLGSGSSAIAAHYANFDFVGTELDADYYAAAVARFNNETRQQAMEL